jgi:hypothetical protein
MTAEIWASVAGLMVGFCLGWIARTRKDAAHE